MVPTIKEETYNWLKAQLPLFLLIIVKANIFSKSLLYLFVLK